MSGTSWVTLATNDSYSLGALVLGHSLRRVGTVHHLTVLITPGVTQPMRDKLTKIFNTVKEVNVLDSQDQANLALLSRPELGITFTKLNCWRLTQFSKGVFLDADTLVLQNCDELFDREELSAAPDAGWPDCFNSGVFVFRPSEATYQALIQFAVSNGSFDGGDQGLLNLFFADWATKDISRHLPFIYNMVSTATYSYLPAFKQFGSNVKIAHFIGSAKPWLQYFDSESQTVTPPPSSTHLQGLLQIWWDIFCSQVHPDLSQDMNHRSSPEARLDTAYTHITNPVPPSNLFNPSEEQDIRDHIIDPWESYSESMSSEQQSKLTEYSDNLNHNPHTTPVKLLEAEMCESQGTDSAQSDNISDHHTEFCDRLPGCEQHVASEFQENIHLDNRTHNSDFLNNSSDNNYNEESCIDLDSINRYYYSDTLSLLISTLHSVEELQIENQQSPILNSQCFTSCEDKHVEITSVNSDHSRVANDSTNNPTESGCDPKAAETDSTEAGLAGALAQLTLGVPRSAEQTALEEHLRRQSWEQGNADYMGRDSFDNIWRKISETLAQVPEPKVDEHKPQDIEARVAESPQITDVPQSQVTQPESKPQDIEARVPESHQITEVPLPQVTQPESKPQDIEARVPESPPLTEVPLSQVTQPESKPQDIEARVPESPPLTEVPLSQVTQPESKPQDIEDRVLESPLITEVPLSQVTQPEFISEVKLQCTEPKVESTPTSNLETTSPVISAATVDKEAAVSSKVTDTTLEIQPEQKLSVNDVDSTSESSANIVTETIPTFISEYPPVDQTTLSDSPASAALTESQNIIQSSTNTIPASTEEVKESDSLITETKVSNTSTPIESSLSENISSSKPQEKDNEASKPVVTSEIPEPGAVPCKSLESPVKSDQQHIHEELGKATILTDTPAAGMQITDTTIPSPIMAPPPEYLQSEVKSDPKLDIKEPITNTEQIILSNATELPPSATESPLLVNVVTDIKIPSQADSSQTIPASLSGSEQLHIPPPTEILPSIQIPIDQPPFVKLSDITESLQSKAPIEISDKKESPAVPDLVPATENQVSSPVTTLSTGPQDVVGSASDSTMKSTQSDSAPQTPDSPESRPVSSALVAVPKKRPAKLPEPPKPTIPLPAPDSASTPPISQLPLDLPPSSDAQILASDLISAVSKSESVPLSPILPSSEVAGVVDTQPTPIQSESKLSTTESISSAQEKTEITSQAPETVQDKKVSKEAGKPQTPTEATKITLEKQSSKEEKQGGKSDIDSKPQTKPSKIIKQSSKEVESSTKPEVSQPVSTEPATVKPKLKGLKGPKGPKSPPTKDAPQTPPPTKDAPPTPPPTKDVPQTPTVTAATPPTSPISTPLVSPNTESLKVDQTQPETPPVTSGTPDVSGSSPQASAAKDPSEAISPPVPPKRKNAKSAVTQSTDGAKTTPSKVSKPVKPKK